MLQKVEFKQVSQFWNIPVQCCFALVMVHFFDQTQSVYSILIALIKWRMAVSTWQAAGKMKCGYVIITAMLSGQPVLISVLDFFNSLDRDKMHEIKQSWQLWRVAIACPLKPVMTAVYIYRTLVAMVPSTSWLQIVIPPHRPSTTNQPTDVDVMQ